MSDDAFNTNLDFATSNICHIIPTSCLPSGQVTNTRDKNVDFFRFGKVASRPLRLEFRNEKIQTTTR